MSAESLDLDQLNALTRAAEDSETKRLAYLAVRKESGYCSAEENAAWLAYEEARSAFREMSMLERSLLALLARVRVAEQEDALADECDEARCAVITAAGRLADAVERQPDVLRALRLGSDGQPLVEHLLAHRSARVRLADVYEKMEKHRALNRRAAPPSPESGA